jgi:hypothetical protein
LHPRYVLAGSLSIALAVFFAIAESWGRDFVASVDVAFVLLSGSCTILALVVVKKMDLRGKFGLVYFSFFIAMLLVFIGNVADAIYNNILRTAEPFPSLADAFYIVGYAAVALPLLHLLWFYRKAVRIKVLQKFVLVFVIFAACLGLIYISMNAVTSVTARTIDLTYPLLDGFLLTLSAMILVSYRSRFISPPVRWFALGLLLTGAAHFLNGLGNAQGWYSYPHPIDLIYLWAYVSFGLGLSIQIKPEGFWK